MPGYRHHPGDRDAGTTLPVEAVPFHGADTGTLPGECVHNIFYAVVRIPCAETRLLHIPNEKNINNAFEGTDMEGSASRCADQLVRDKILFSKSLGSGKFQYAAYNNEGEVDVKPFEDQIDKKSTSAFITEELSDKTRIVDAIMLGGALKLRYELKYVSASDFDSTIKQLRKKFRCPVDLIVLLHWQTGIIRIVRMRLLRMPSFWKRLWKQTVSKAIRKNGHYTDTDSYPVEDTFDPAPRSWWLPECNEFISLREAPSAQAAVLEQIPVGDRFLMLALDEEYAFVNYNGRYGYVLQSYIKQE